MAKFQEHRNAHTRRRIIAAACRLFAERGGFDAVTLTEIAASAGVANAYVQFSVINVTKDPDVFEYRVEDGGDADCGSHSGWEGQPYQLAEGDCFEFHVWLERSSDHAMIPGSADSAQWRNYNHAKQECPGVD
jgi:hypothetical protein